MKNRILFLLLSTIIISLLEGCIPSKPTKEEVELLPSERLINKLEVNRRKIRSFEGTGTLHVKSPEFDQTATFRVVVQKPDSIQLNIIGPFGIELADILVTEREFVFYDAIHNQAYTGIVDDDVLRKIFKINLGFTDLMDAFIGSVNLTKNLYKQPTAYIVEDDHYILTYIDSTTMVTSTYNIDIKELGIKKYELSDLNDKVILEGLYSDFELLENVAIPYNVTVRNIEQNQVINITYKTMQANKPSIKINFSIPEDAEIIQW